MAEAKAKWSKGQLLMVVAISMATFMTTLDAGIVSIAMPSISMEFHQPTSIVSWIVILYGLMLSSLLLTFGKLADTVGYKKLFMIGLVVFTLGSVLCGLAPDIYSLIIFRGVQGVGASMVAALTLAMVSMYLPTESKGKGLGIVSTFMALGVGMGPVIGGLLTQYLSWRWIFFVNVPICAIALIMGMKYIPADDLSKARKEKFDVTGAGLFFGMIFTFLLAINNGTALGWGSPVIIGLFLAALVLLLLFIFNERKAVAPMLSKAITKNRNIMSQNFAGLALEGAGGGIFLLMPFYFELVRKNSVSDTGFLMFVSSIAIMIFGLIAGKLSDKRGSRMICVVACAVVALSCIMLSTIGASTGYPFILFALFLMGMGFGMYMPAASNLILRQTPREAQGVSTGLINTFRNLGYVIGLTVMEAVGEAVVPNITEHTPPADLARAFDAAFLAGFVICIIAIALALISRDARKGEAHPVDVAV
jgi:DHA2 family metal-tetracycline-proton antiporter-like MFS transporter